MVKSELVQRRSSRAIHICINATLRTSWTRYWAKLPTRSRVTIGWNYAVSRAARGARETQLLTDNVVVAESTCTPLGRGKEVCELLNRR